MTTEITKPAPLDPYKLHTPAEVDTWKAATHAYFDTLREEENRERMKEEAANAYANRVITRDEYHALAVKRKAEQDAKQAERDAAKKAKEAEEAEYLASMPEVAEVNANSEHLFLLQLQNWLAKGYQVVDDSIQFWGMGFYNVRLNKPATPAKAKK